jgi:hypothetical protein
MQTIITEVEQLTGEVQRENVRLLKMIERMSAVSYNHESSESIIKTDKSVREESREVIPKVNSKEDFDLSISRKTFQTVKHSNYVRCESCFTIKNSRQTSKTLSKNKKKVGEIRHESNMAKLKKISQKIIPKVSKEVLFRKKSKIFHFETHV